MGMAITTEDVALFDLCPRLRLYSAWEPPRASLAASLNDALRIALLNGKAEDARMHLMQRAANPGFNISTWNTYDIAVHHAHLIELIAAYLLAGEGAWKPAPMAAAGAHDFQPFSFVLPSGKLRRVVLCSKWDDLRKFEECHGWRTMADIVALDSPMLINVIVIGNAVKGMRPSVWTRCFEHPVAKTLRIKSNEGNGEAFNGNWRRIYRESTALDCAKWLRLMQEDNAFVDVVQSVTVEVPGNVNEVKRDLGRIAEDIANGRSEMHRSQCFKINRCVYVDNCYASPPTSPAEIGWQKKSPLS